MELYGIRGWGSAITETMLAWVGQPYDFVDVEGFDAPGPARDRLSAVNPLAQVPALVLDDGSVMTESAAITLFLADSHPQLAPKAGSPDRGRFLRLLVWLVANVYPTFTYGDYPQRWTPTAPQELVQAVRRYRKDLYLWLDGEVVGPFILGPAPSALDLYMAVMTQWGPRQAWFERNAPRLTGVAARARELPGVGAVMARNGWG